MTTDEIIRKLRFRADTEMSAEETRELLTEAADRLEELDERVAIMMEGQGTASNDCAGSGGSAEL